MTSEAEASLCEEADITSVVIPNIFPNDTFSLGSPLAPPGFAKNYLAAWVLTDLPGYRFLAFPDADVRITDCRVFEEQSLMAAIEESYDGKIWIG